MIGLSSYISTTDEEVEGENGEHGDNENENKEG
jgi:hypothetical protein